MKGYTSSRVSSLAAHVTQYLAVFNLAAAGVSYNIGNNEDAGMSLGAAALLVPSLLSSHASSKQADEAESKAKALSTLIPLVDVVLGEVVRQSEEFRKQYETQSDEVRALEVRRVGLEQECAKLEQKCAELEQNSESLQRDLEAGKTELEKCTEQLAETNKKLEETKAEIVDGKKRLEAEKQNATRFLEDVQEKLRETKGRGIDIKQFHCQRQYV